MNNDLGVMQVGNHLQGKSIALCVTGSIAAIEAPRIARALRREGAVVHAYLTSSALQFVGRTAMEWATTNPCVVELSGLAEHICTHDLVLIAPATLNTLSKILLGLADSSVSTLVASALGLHVPVLAVPAMHDSLMNNPILQKHLSNAAAYGLTVMAPRLGEGKAKIQRQAAIAAEVCRLLSTSALKGTRILVTGGPTPVRIDSVRRITNVFTGRLAVIIASEAYKRGADVCLLLGKTGIEVPNHLRVVFHDDYDQYRSNVLAELAKGYKIGIFSAAVADYAPQNVQKGKIPSGVPQSLVLVPTRKVIQEVRAQFPSLFMVTFKYEDGISVDALLNIATERITSGYQMVVANLAEEMRSEHCAYICGPVGVIAHPKGKQAIAHQLLDAVEVEHVHNNTRLKETR